MAPNCTIWPSELNQKRFFLFSRVTYYTRRDQRVPPSNLFRHCETFFPEIFFQRAPFIFLLFCDRMDVGKSQRSPLSILFGTVRFFSENISFSLLQFFDVLRQKPFNCDKNVDDFGSVPLPARQGLALAGPGAPLCPFFEYVIFSIFGYCKREYLTLGSLFAIFEPWILRRLGPVPACCNVFSLFCLRMFSSITPSSFYKL